MFDYRQTKYFLYIKYRCILTYIPRWYHRN